MIRLAALALFIGGLIKGAGNDYVGASSALVLAAVLAAISARVACRRRNESAPHLPSQAGALAD